MPLLPRRRRRALVAGGNPNTIRLPAVRASGDSVGADGALTAAGFRIRHDDTEKLRRLIQPWQARAFGYYDRLGEIKYASQFYARMLASLRLYVAKRDPDTGDWNEIEDKSEAPAQVDALERIQDPGGGRESLLSSYGRLIFLAGEGYLLCTLDKDSGVEQWEFLSTDELRIQGGIIMRYRSPSLEVEDYREPSDDDWVPIDDDTAVTYRLWRRHPRYSMLADSTMMGVLDLCEELLLLTLAVRARARSRLASAGILLVAEGIDYRPAEPVPDEDTDEDPFLRDLTTAMMAPIQNEGSASAVVPLVVRVPDDYVENGMKHIQLVDPTQLYPETGLRRECIERIAIGLDMPPEILLGMSDANHWTVWMIDEQTWKAHGQPVANQFVNDLNSAYFLPQMRADGIEDWQDYRIEYDATAIVNHPDRTKDAKDLFNLETISKAALRDAAGFTEDDAMPEDELAERVGIKTHDSSLAWFGTPAPRGGALEVAPGEVVSPAGDASANGASADGKTTGAEVEAGPPSADAPSPNEELIGAAALQVSRIVGAADLAVLRAREAAGNRLRSLAKRDPELAKLIEGVPARDVPSTIGHERARTLATAADLVAGSGELVRETLVLWGIKDSAAVGLIAERLEEHAARTLFEERAPVPPQFRAYVSGVLQGR